MAQSHQEVVKAWPALKRLGFVGGKKSVPFVQQLEWTDCGAASLCMVMAYHGREAKLAEVREAMGIGRDGEHRAHGPAGPGGEVRDLEAGRSELGQLGDPLVSSHVVNQANTSDE